jgi:hypothetical protein
MMLRISPWSNCKTHVEKNIFILQDSQEIKTTHSTKGITKQNIDKIKLDASIEN